MRRHRGSIMTALVLAAVLGAAFPALAAGNPPSGRLALIYTASSGLAPQGVILDGQYIRLATPDCPAPARMLVDGQTVYECPRPLKLRPLPPRPGLFGQ
jgi:hypothetical protein